MLEIKERVVAGLSVVILITAFFYVFMFAHWTTIWHEYGHVAAINIINPEIECNIIPIEADRYYG